MENQMEEELTMEFITKNCKTIGDLKERIRQLYECQRCDLCHVHKKVTKSNSK